MYIEVADSTCVYTEMLNDTFYYFKYGEEPLDEEAYKEIKAWADKYPDGFLLDRHSAESTEPGIIGAVLYPVRRICIDAYWQATKYIKICIKYEGTGHIRLWWLNGQSGKAKYKGMFEIKNNKESPYFSTGKNSMYFLKAFIKA